MRTFMLALVLILAVLSPASAAVAWLTDYDAAQTAAKAAGKPVLLVFSGSDWCIWCQRLDGEVLHTPVFEAWAKDAVVPCLLDFPRAQGLVSAPQRARNQEVMDRFGAQGFPTVLLLAADGTVLVRTGYQSGGPEPYVAGLKGSLAFVTAAAALDAALEGLPPAERLARQAATLRGVTAQTRELARPLAQAVFGADPQNTTGALPTAALIVALDPATAADVRTRAETVLSDGAAAGEPGPWAEYLREGFGETFGAMMEGIDQGSKEVSPEGRAAALRLVKLSDDLVKLIDDDDERAAVLLRRGIALAAAGQPTEAAAAFTAAEAAGAPAQKVAAYRGFAEGLGGTAAR